MSVLKGLFVIFLLIVLVSAFRGTSPPPTNTLPPGQAQQLQQWVRNANRALEFADQIPYSERTPELDREQEKFRDNKATVERLLRANGIAVP